MITDEDVEMQDEAPEDLRQDLTCPVCQGIFSDPLILGCTHSFCRTCLQRSWQVNKSCPVCRKHFTEDKAVPNRVLKNLCETFVKQTSWRRPPKLSEFSCTLHFKPLDLFCEWDARPVCVDCATLHSTHRLLSVKDALPICKSELNEKLVYFERKIESFEKMMQKFIQTMEFIELQAKEAESQIREEFEKLHDFLRDEENRRLTALETEKVEKTITVQDKIQNTEEGLKILYTHVDTLKKGLDCDDLPLLMDFQNLKIQTNWTKSVPQIEPNCLLPMNKHVGSLGFDIWKSMKDCVQYYPVVLDSNTASPWLNVSPDLISVKESPERLSLPENLDRFDPCVFVLGADGYTSGKHKWEVTVGDSSKWIVGVCKKSVPRKKTFTVSSSAGVWAIRLSKGVYDALTKEPTPLQVTSRPEKICVRLNMDKGEVSFYDGTTTKHLVSLTFKLGKGEKIYPIFGPGLQSTPMTIVPGKVTIHT